MSKLFKTRSTPFQACNKIRVSVNDMPFMKFKYTRCILFRGNKCELTNIILITDT